MSRGEAVGYLMSKPSRLKGCPNLSKSEFQYVDLKYTFYDSVGRIGPREIYNNFREKGWTTEQAFIVKDLLLPEIVRALALVWFSAAEEAYDLNPRNRNE